MKKHFRALDEEDGMRMPKGNPPRRKQTGSPKVGQLVTLGNGWKAKIVKVHPMGTVDVEVPETGKYYRVSGLPMTKTNPPRRKRQRPKRHTYMGVYNVPPFKIVFTDSKSGYIIRKNNLNSYQPFKVTSGDVLVEDPKSIPARLRVRIFQIIMAKAK